MHARARPPSPAPAPVRARPLPLGPASPPNVVVSSPELPSREFLLLKFGVQHSRFTNLEFEVRLYSPGILKRNGRIVQCINGFKKVAEW